MSKLLPKSIDVNSVGVPTLGLIYEAAVRRPRFKIIEDCRRRDWSIITTGNYQGMHILMEEAARRRLERLRNFELGVSEPVIVGVKLSDENGDRDAAQEGVTTLESLARNILSENTFVPDQQPDNEKIELKRQNWDLKKEYERKCEPLELLKAKVLEQYLEKRISGDNTDS